MRVPKPVLDSPECDLVGIGSKGPSGPLEIVLTPIVIRVQIPHFINVQRAVVGVATAHLEPGQLPLAFGGGGQDYRVTETTTTAVIVIAGWLIGWTLLGAWRMATRDA